MLAISLQSGSNGNCTYVEADGVRLLFDAGISGLQAQRRLGNFGRDISNVDALLISHNHRDHIRAAGIYQRKFGIPIYVTKPTLAEAVRWCDLGQLDNVHHFKAGDRLRFGGATIETIPTPHDAADGVAFVIDAGGRRLGIMTDLGHVFDELPEVIASLDAAILESNYDAEMLTAGLYTPALKARISGHSGHLSNVESARLLCRAGRKLRWACLAHISHENNTPGLALHTHREMLKNSLPLHIATRYEPSGILHV